MPQPDGPLYWNTCDTPHWDKHTAGRRCLRCKFIRDKNAALGKHVYPRDETPSDEFLSGIKMPLVFLSWWQVDASTACCFLPGKFAIVIFNLILISFLISSVGIFIPGGSNFALGKRCSGCIFIRERCGSRIFCRRHFCPSELAEQTFLVVPRGITALLFYLFAWDSYTIN